MANNGERHEDPGQRARPPEDPRVRLAGERTLLAWIRTGLALMGFGFVVARFGLFLREIAPKDRPPQHWGLSLWLGTALVLTGIAVNALSAWQYTAFLRQLDRGEPYRPPSWSLGVVLALFLAVLGIGMTVYLLVLAG